MAISVGTRLGPYEILSPLGAGGMGEVYLAKDTRLDRTVAIKVLPALAARDPDSRQRFEREARAVSSLSHPHICTLYDIGHQDGIDFLVMEYLEGETLAKRLSRGALPTDQLLRYAIEIADALDKAHRRGVIHRDLTPNNVMLTKSGAKLLDFGLAKLRKPEARPRFSAPSVLPTKSQSLTAEGKILGTLQYMAPEQLEGKELDARTDIFALGTLVYEMATGRKAFAGKSQANVVAAILDSDPLPIATLQPMAPPALDHVVKTCLVKDPDERWQTAHDVLVELQWIAESGSQGRVPAAIVTRLKTRESLALITASVLFVIACMTTLVLAITYFRSTATEVATVQFVVSEPKDATFDSDPASLALSPDGRRLAFVASSPEGKRLLWVRSLDSLFAQALPGTEGASPLPFWSPDSRLLAFFAGGKLKKIDILGGPPQTVCDAPNGRSGAWNSDGTIVFLPNPGAGLYRVSAAGGTATSLTALDQSGAESVHLWPQFLSDGRHFIYLVRSARPESKGIYLGSLDSSDRKRLLNADSNPAYALGYLLFSREGTLLAQPFDARDFRVAGEPVPFAEQVAYNAATGRAAFSVSENGVLAYRTAADDANTQLTWFDRGGNQLGSIGPTGNYADPALSPDEERVAVTRPDPGPGTRDIWLIDSSRGASRFTFDPSWDIFPLWSPDGNHIVFGSNRAGSWDLYQKLSSGAGHDEVLLKSNATKLPLDWSRDGRFILYEVVNPKTGRDLSVLPLFGDRRPIPFLETEFNEYQAQFSPDGRWVAYASDESGTPEVYVQTFPPSGGKWQISTNGGSEPRWRRDGQELFYIAADRKLMVVAVKADSTFKADVPKALFETRVSVIGARNHYVVGGNRQRFLINTAVEEASSVPITVVVNWTAALRK